VERLRAGNPSLKLSAFPVPSHTKGKFMPTFLGGSDLAIPASSPNRTLAIDWIRTFTGTQYMRQLTSEAHVIPNTTSLASVNQRDPKLAPFAQAAKASWFVPTAPNWVNVESAGVLQNMLASIATGRSSVEKAANRASTQITQMLNAR
jgi:N,N'-diacetylchitobiose transport system substrate-binding protein